MHVRISNSDGVEIASYPVPDLGVLEMLDAINKDLVCIVLGNFNADKYSKWQGSARQYITAAEDILQQIDNAAPQVVTKVWVEMDDGSIRGPARGITGLTLYGRRAMVRCDYRGKCFLRYLTAHGSDETVDLSGMSSVRVDDGVIRIEHEKASFSLESTIQVCKKMFSSDFNQPITVQVD